MGRKVNWTPVILQLEALECGAASLSMIMAYYGKWVSLEEVRNSCGISRNGSKASNIIKAAKYYNFDAHGYRMTIEELKDLASYPCIIYWNNNHFVVLCGFKGNRACICDPADGKVIISKEVFEKSYSGVCLTFSKTPLFTTSPKPKTSVVNYVFKRLNASKIALFFAIGVSIIATAIGLVSPKFSEYFYDKVLAEHTELNIFTILFCGFIIFEALFLYFSTSLSYRISGRLDVNGSTRYIKKILNLPMNFFEQHSTGDLLIRKTSTGSLASNIVFSLGPLVVNIIVMIITFIIMLNYNFLLSMIALATFALSVLSMVLALKPKVAAARLQRRSYGTLYSKTYAGLEIAETLKSLGCEDSYYDKWKVAQVDYEKDYRHSIAVSTILNSIPQLVSTISSLLVIVIGVYFMIQGSFTIGILTAFQGYLSSFLSPAYSIIQSSNQINDTIADQERIDDVLNNAYDPLVTKKKRLEEDDEADKMVGHIVLDHVTFGYGRLEPPVLKDISIEITPGMKIAFVGGSGSGKSTISKLICGLYHPWSGKITYDGRKIKEIPRSVFTGSIAVVDQDISLFNDTFENNIKMWDSTIEDFEMILAAKDAQIHDRIMAGGGYKEKIVSEGKNLSGGERQRIEIARVLAQDPSIIILDEATSALDAKTEQAVVKSISDRGITCIIIAHRLSTIRDCDKIVVLNHGVIQETGTHEELMKLGGFYSELVLDE